MNPHKVEWTEEKVREFWRVNHAHFSKRRYSQQVGPALARIVGNHAAAGGVVLDYGCGSGDLLRVLDTNRYTLLGTDYEMPSGFVPYAPSREKGVRYFVPPEQMKELGSSVDMVLLIEVVEHLEDPVLEGILARAYDLLRDGGQLLVTTPNREDLVYNTVNCPDCGCIFHRVQHVRSWTAEALLARMRQGRFTAVRVMETDLGRMQRSPLSRLIRTALDKYDRRVEPHLVGLFQKGQ